tara:strand:- start:1564 stop:3468 length:1905 start_codon:yes stop_codon:yes gene_type:complete
MEIYCPSLTTFQRLNTRCVNVGDVGIGGKNPIRIQSMTTTNTMDTKNTISQSIRMIEAGCEIVRITAPSIKEAENLKNIKNGLRERGYKTPLVADIHFTPNAAKIAAKIVEKVRINPGNYADRKNFKTYEYTDQSYINELDRIRDRFVPLVRICKENGTAMRIGTNHGSLSDRIMSRYGDSPTGMVESAMEFLRIAEDEGYKDIVLSMKSSNTQVMVQAYRLLVQKMNEEQMNYPLHLGVTEAGEAEDGRIKSAVGIGTLLEDGLGDTIRVSLTEEPEREIPVAKILVNRKNLSENYGEKIKTINSLPYDPFFYKRRKTNSIINIGHKQVPRVIGNISTKKSISQNDLASFGYIYAPKEDKWHISEQAIDYLYIGKKSIDFEIPGRLRIISDYKKETGDFSVLALFKVSQIDFIPNNEITFLSCKDSDNIFEKLKLLPNCIVVLETDNTCAYSSLRQFFIECMEQKILNPIIIKRAYNNLSADDTLIYAATDVGALQIDGFGDGVWINTSHSNSFSNEISFGILQASRTRISKTEYISCPSCGRTLFDLQETTEKIRSKTDHLKGIKIGIMGCIVNGPGEMADADYGYVGTGPGLISLYKGQNVVEKNIKAENAVDALIGLIQKNGDWKDPNNV